MDRAAILGEGLKAELRRLAERNDTVAMANIRGPGAMVAFDIMRGRGSKEPDAAATRRVTQAALEEGLILLSCGVNGNTIRLLMPLTIGDDVLRQGMARLERALVAANG